MHSIRSVLWIGPGPGLAESGVLDCPTLDVTWVPDVGEALCLPPSSFDAEILDAEPESTDGSRLVGALRRLRAGPRRSPVIVRIPSVGGAPESDLLGAGASAVVQRTPGPASREARHALLERIETAAAARRWASAPASSGRGTQPAERGAAPVLPGIVGRSPAMQQLASLIEHARESSVTVLIGGETGTGKEVVARALHELGVRRRRPFVAVNCAAFPDALLESELFGHVKGAFTGADREKAGLFEVADGGTIFLDEIGETSASLQASLLRVLQEREIRPVGSSRSRKIDARVIAATNRPLREAVATGRFRDDLYYRLAVFPIPVPPLRERREDVTALAEHFLEHHGRRENVTGCALSKAAAELLLAYDWPGNVRELENEMQRSLALAEPGALITPRLLSERVRQILEPIRENARPGDTLRDNLNRIEAWLIRRSLEQHGGRRTATARKLGVTREGLYKKMKRLRIE